MAFNNDGVEIKITSDSSQAVREFSKIKQAFEKIKAIENAQVNAATSFQFVGWENALKNIEPVYKNLGQSLIEKINQSSEALNTIGQKFESTFGSMFKTITAGATAVAGAISFVTKNALAIGGGFEAQMTSVKVISGATTEELDALTKKAREMGATLPITAKDAASAMTLLAQRGNDANKILASVTAVSNLAISQAVDMAAAADILGSTITSFAMSVDDADKITAIFNNACNQSALSMSKLIEAMKYVGPAASAVDMELTEAVSAMEALANAGLTGEMVGTGLKLVLNKLSAEPRILGVETKKLDGSLRSLADIFSELKQKEATLADYVAMFGQRGALAALNLAKLSGSLKTNQERLKQWDSTQNAVNEKMKTFTNTLNAFRSASEELHIEIFEQIKNQAKDTVGSIAELTRQFSKWVGETDIAGKALNSFLNGLGFNIPNADSFQKLLNKFNVQSFLDSIQSFGNALKNIANSIVGAFNMIKAPLLWLIQHLGTFATVSFWGWIIGKGLRIPAAIIDIARSFKELFSASKKLLSLSWNSFLNPLTIAVGVGSAVAYSAGAAKAEAEAAEREFNKTIKRIQDEIKDADYDLQLHIDLDVKTGFEKIPESYFKASDQLRASFDEINKAAKVAFKNQFAQALDFVLQKFPQLSEEAKKAGINLNNIGNNVYSAITRALSGDENSYKALPDIFRKVTERINQMNLALGKGNQSLIYTIAKFDNLARTTEKMKPQNKVKTFYEELSANLRNVFANLPKQIEEANKFLNSANPKLAVDVSLEQAKSQLDAFVKDAADRFAIPEDIVKEATLNKLKELAAVGNKTAQALLKAWGNVDTSFDDFIDKAKEAIQYLGDSPQKFIPALTSMLHNIQKIDPITGKLTEKFKKAHDALKEWANVTFDKLTTRIQKLRKAVEGGFIDKSVLEKEFMNVLPQIKLQVLSEIEPMKNQFASQRDYQATLASELVAKVQDLFGDVGTQLLRNTYDGKTGIEIGRSIVNEMQRVDSSSQGTININGIEQSLSNAISPLTNALNNTGDSMLAFINSIRTPTSDEFGNQPAMLDYSGQFSSVIQQFSSLNSATNDNTTAVRSVEAAVNNLQSAIAALQSGNTYNIDIQQNGFSVQSKAAADALARSTVSAFRSGLGNGGL